MQCIEYFMNKERSLLSRIVIFVSIVIINILLARFGVITYKVGPTVSALYPAVAFEIAFALWFGGWGFIAAYIGTFVGAGLGFVPFEINIFRSLCDVWQVIIPFLAFRFFKADISLKTSRDFIIFVVFAWLLNNVAGAIWGTFSLVLGGIESWDRIPYLISGWVISNLITTIAITPLLLKYVTPLLENKNLLNKDIWK